MPPPPSPGDQLLVARLRAGDEAAFESLVHAEYGPLCSFARRMLPTDAVTEEIIQSVFLKLWTARSRLPAIGNLRAFLYKSARNAVLDHLKRAGIEDRYAALVGGADEVEVDPTPGAQAELERHETEEALHAAVARLPERSRQVVTLRWGREMTHAEIAEALGISVKGVEIHITRALRALRGYLKAR
jgi:RNA polymerase sigma-70 factor (ECF subfamily)